MIRIIRAEGLKLRRSSVWVFALLLPLLATISGSVNYWMNREVLQGGWDSMTGQVTLFYGLLFFAVSVALQASASWRVEHHGSTWNAMLTTEHSPFRLVLGKAIVLFGPLVVTQMILVALTWAFGVGMGLPGVVPGSFVLSASLTVVAAVPLVLFQILLSMLMRSFAAPVGVCLMAAILSFGAVLSHALPMRVLAALLPQAVVSKAIFLGSSAVSDGGALAWADIWPILLNAAGQAVFLTLLIALITTRRTI